MKAVPTLPLAPSEPTRARDLGHELRNALAPIVGHAELLRVRDDAGYRVRAAEMILNACEHLSTLLDEVATLHPADDAREGTREPAPRAARRLVSPSPVEAPPVVESPAGDRRVVLIADDDASVRSLLRMTVSAETFQIVEASDGREALDLVAVRTPDLVLLDWNMPGRSGSQVLEHLREEHPSLPVIVVTAEQDSELREQAEALGATFLTKPFSPVELLNRIDVLLPGVL